MNFEIGNVYIAFVKFDDKKGGKVRPILVWNHHKNLVFYKITTKFVKKSKSIEKKYFPIFDWRELGFPRASYVDTTKYYPIEYLEEVDDIQYLTKISAYDKKRFDDFINS